MKMPQHIIEKFKLYPSNEQAGESFVNNLIIFKSDLPALEDIRFMECDLGGNPSRLITILNKETKNVFEVTPEFMGDISIELIVKQLME